MKVAIRTGHSVFRNPCLWHGSTNHFRMGNVALQKGMSEADSADWFKVYLHGQVPALADWT